MIYSAVGSFYAPMLVMMFFNWRIYREEEEEEKQEGKFSRVYATD